MDKLLQSLCALVNIPYTKANKTYTQLIIEVLGLLECIVVIEAQLFYKSALTITSRLAFNGILYRHTMVYNTDTDSTYLHEKVQEDLALRVLVVLSTRICKEEPECLKELLSFLLKINPSVLQSKEASYLFAGLAPENIPRTALWTRIHFYNVTSFISVV